MTFTELLNTIATMTDEESKTYGLVFDEITYQTLMSLQEQNPSQHQIAPVQLSDGRYASCADILREAVLGGIYASGFSTIPQELYENVGVMSWSDVIELLPKSDFEV
jgi:hypothetical protein